MSWLRFMTARWTKAGHLKAQELRTAQFRYPKLIRCPSYPIGVYPHPEALVERRRLSNGCSLDYLAAACLVAASSIMGGERRQTQGQ